MAAMLGTGLGTGEGQSLVGEGQETPGLQGEKTGQKGVSPQKIRLISSDWFFVWKAGQVD